MKALTGVTLITGFGTTVITIDEDDVQPPVEVPVTKQVVVETGFATTVFPVDTFNPTEGDHKYVVAPVAVKLVAFPTQIEFDIELIFIAGAVVNVKVVEELTKQPFWSTTVTE